MTFLIYKSTILFLKYLITVFVKIKIYRAPKSTFVIEKNAFNQRQPSDNVNFNSQANPRTRSKCTVMDVHRRILLIPRKLTIIPDTIPHLHKALVCRFLRAIDWPESDVSEVSLYTLLNNNLACTDERELNSVPRRAPRCFHIRSFLSSFRREGGRVSHIHIYK